MIIELHRIKDGTKEATGKLELEAEDSSLLSNILTQNEREGLEQRFASGVMATLVIGFDGYRRVITMAIPERRDRTLTFNSHIDFSLQLANLKCDHYLIAFRI